MAEVDGLGPQAGLPALHASATTPATTRLALAVVAMASAVLALWLAMHHALSPPLAVAGVLLLAAAQARWPGLWLVALPALLPWLGLAPWSGWLLVEETDLAVLAVAAGGWLHWSLRPARQGLAGRGSRPMLGLGLLLLALWAVLVAVAAQRGVVDAGGWTFGWWQGYREPMNALRLAKPTLVVLLLLPLWCQLQHENQHAADLLTAGMTVSLAGTAMWCLWERAAFPGLLNAATDYRSTGPFWEAHVGGAALDVWLALTLPFALRQMSRARSPWALAAAGTAVLLGIYAALTTFSRIVYLALPVGVVLMLWLQAAQAPAAAGEGAAPAAHAGAAAPGWTSALALCAGVGALAHWLFPLAGYRGLLALLGNAWVLMLLLPRSANRPARAWAMVALAGVPAGLLVAAVALQFGKGAYWAYAVACVATTAWLLWLPQPLGQRRWLLASIGFVVQLACSVAVALHWGGPPAWPAAAAAAGCAMLAWLVLAQRQRSPWPASARWVGSTSLGLVLVAAAVSVFGAGDYMATRLGQTEADRAGRWQHWRDGLALVPNGTPWWLGSGLGRYADLYALHGRSDARPGDLRLVRVDDGAAMRLVAGNHLQGPGEWLRLSQRIGRPARGALTLTLQLRAAAPLSLVAEVCVKHLIYGGECRAAVAAVPAATPAGGAGWQTVRLLLPAEPAPLDPWFLPRLTVFSLASETPRQPLLVRSLALTDASGRDWLHNGSFADGGARWFSSSDRNHLPWHAKNMALHLLVEQGLVGLLALMALTLAALAGLLGPLRRHPLAPALAGAIVGCWVVGAVDSVMDIPRVASWLLLLTTMALALHRPSRAQGRGRVA